MSKLKTLSIAFLIILGLGLNTITHAGQTTAELKKPAIPEATKAISNSPAKEYETVNPVAMVEYPELYLNKNVKFKAKFDKFSTLGLDYKPAFRSSEKYISFLIQRGNVTTHNVPLSELKIFLTRTEAEKHIELDAGDEIEVCGKVFSNALGDVWMDAEKFTVISTKADKTEK